MELTTDSIIEDVDSTVLLISREDNSLRSTTSHSITKHTLEMFSFLHFISVLELIETDMVDLLVLTQEVVLQSSFIIILILIFFILALSVLEL